MKLLPTPTGPTSRTCSLRARNWREKAASRSLSRRFDSVKMDCCKQVIAWRVSSPRRRSFEADQVCSKPALCRRSSSRLWSLRLISSVSMICRKDA